MQQAEKSSVISATILCYMLLFLEETTSVNNMILFVLLCIASILKDVSTEWIEIPQPIGESVTQASSSTKESDTTLNYKYTTFATTKTTNGDVFLNETISSKFRMGPEFLNSESQNEFTDYIENVQNKLLKPNRGTLKNKLNILLELKKNLLYNIKNKISNLWSFGSNRREAKHLEKEDEYHMDFPSNEGALMTIGFLTFAVFLIKLVLKLITAIKDKNNAMTTTTPATVLFGRKKRDVYEDEIRILRYIDEYKFQ